MIVSFLSYIDSEDSFLGKEGRLLRRLSNYSELRGEAPVTKSEYQFVGAFAQLGIVRATQRKNIEVVLFFSLIFSFIFWALMFGLMERAVFLVSLSLGFSLFLFALLLVRKKVIANYHRKLLFELSFFLENLLLLCSAGLGLSAAVQRVTHEEAKGSLTPFFIEFLRRLENGDSSQEATSALAEVAPIAAIRHVFVQLDLGTGVGAPVTDVLSALNEYSAEEWRLCVESSIRRIEVAVVFPVFAAVFGFLLLVASGPIVSIANLDLERKSDVSRVIRAER